MGGKRREIVTDSLWSGSGYDSTAGVFKGEVKQKKIKKRVWGD